MPGTELAGPESPPGATSDARDQRERRAQIVGAARPEVLARHDGDHRRRLVHRQGSLDVVTSTVGRRVESSAACP
jgi:hypothetical protein